MIKRAISADWLLSHGGVFVLVGVGVWWVLDADLTSMPAARMPVSVDSCTAFFSVSKRGSKDTVQAQSMIRPSTCPATTNK